MAPSPSGGAKDNPYGFNPNGAAGDVGDDHGGSGLKGALGEDGMIAFIAIVIIVGCFLVIAISCCIYKCLTRSSSSSLERAGGAEMSALNPT